MGVTHNQSKQTGPHDFIDKAGNAGDEKKQENPDSGRGFQQSFSILNK